MKSILTLLFLSVFTIVSFGQIISEIKYLDSLIKEKVELKGEIFTHTIQSSFLNETRTFTIYTPPGHDTLKQLGVLFVTDQMCEHVAQIAEPMILDGKIRPLIIVGLNHRPHQPEDDEFEEYKPDFRGMDYHAMDIIFSEKYIPLNKVTPSLQNRHEKFKNHVLSEVVPHILNNYNVSQNTLNWTLGGFSNGAAFALSVSLSEPENFRNVILLSPADLNPSDKKYNFNSSSPNYFIASGIDEPSFLNTGLSYAKQLDSLELNFIHHTYNGGHEFNLWLNAYANALIHFYVIDKIQPCNTGLVNAFYPGGTFALNKFISNEMQYPELSMQMGDQGRVYIEFIIEKDGSTSNPKIVRGITPELDQEALRLFSLIPRWIPATKDCEPVKTKYTIPFTFGLR